MEKDDIELLYDHYWTSKDTIHMAGHTAPGMGGHYSTEISDVGICLIFTFGTIKDHFEILTENPITYEDKKLISSGFVWKKNKKSFEALTNCLKDLEMYDIVLDSIRAFIIQTI